MKNDFNYKWSKIFASKRFKREDGFVLLAPIEQHELLEDAESLVKKLTLTDVGSSFVEYEKQVSMDAITLKDITEDNVVVGRYLLDGGKLYKIDLVEKYTLIDLK